MKLELQVAELEEQVDQRTYDLAAAVEEKEKLKTNLDQERESRQVCFTLSLSLSLSLSSPPSLSHSLTHCDHL